MYISPIKYDSMCISVYYKVERFDAYVFCIKPVFRIQTIFCYTLSRYTFYYNSIVNAQVYFFFLTLFLSSTLNLLVPRTSFLSSESLWICSLLPILYWIELNKLYCQMCCNIKHILHYMGFFFHSCFLPAFPLSFLTSSLPSFLPFFLQYLSGTVLKFTFCSWLIICHYWQHA